MTVASLLQPLCFREFDNNGNPLAFGTVASYQAGTTTPTPTYTDSTAGTANPNPLTLNARGEAQIWCLPNVSYKFVIEDSTGNTIRTVDNVQQSQILSLYGGVDTGTANAYVITFAANFATYQDGIVIYWIPSNTNTSGSTLNVNGLGALNIVNPDGSALQAGQLLANQPVEVLLKSGQWILLNSVLNEGSFTGNYTGFTTTVTGSINWSRTGNLICLLIQGAVGTSNSTTFAMTGLPSAIQPATSKFISVPDVVLYDNGGFVQGSMSINGGTVTFSKNGGSWTASGTKGLQNTFEVFYSLQ